VWTKTKMNMTKDSDFT